MTRLSAFALSLAALVMMQPASAQTQAQMNVQAANDLRQADAALNAQWRQTYASMKDRDAGEASRGGGFGYAAAALASQRAWLQFRDKQCVIEGGQYAGGSLQGFARGQCLARLTRERTKQLEDLMWTR